MKNIAAFLLALMLAAPAAAEGIIPRERLATADREGKFSGDHARKTMDQFAACVLDRRRKMVLEALSMPSDSPEQNKLFGLLSKTECIASAQLYFNGPSFRGSLYKALVSKQFGRKEVSLTEVISPGNQQAIPQGNGARSLGEAGLLKFASCVVHKDPQSARDAILSTAGSEKEDQAMTALANVYGQCLYEDSTLRFSRGSLIGLLAEAYYRDGNASAEKSAVQ
jgi:hypothetical protein